MYESERSVVACHYYSLDGARTFARCKTQFVEQHNCEDTMRPSANHILAAVVASVLGTWSAGAYALPGSVDPYSVQDYVASGSPLSYQAWVDEQVASAQAVVDAAQGNLSGAQ